MYYSRLYVGNIDRAIEFYKNVLKLDLIKIFQINSTELESLHNLKTRKVTVAYFSKSSNQNVPTLELIEVLERSECIILNSLKERGNIGLYVSDIDRSIEFYKKVLELRHVVSCSVSVRNANKQICLANLVNKNISLELANVVFLSEFLIED